MSWDADLYAVTEAPKCPHCGGSLGTPDERRMGSWNYTHNTNAMIAEAVRVTIGAGTPQATGPLGPVIGPAWWKRLDGVSGHLGAAYLASVIEGLESDPERFRAMDPPNGWGSYDTLLEVLREMQREPGAIDEPTVWRVNG